jgi:phosphatidylglycerol:prolipoprotein diacylglycerol transferase
MRQTLFFIPDRAFGVPVFGFGWLLLAWVVFSLAVIVFLVRRHGWKADTLGYLPFMFIVAAVFAFALPMLEQKSPDGRWLGLPVRGYGTFVLAGFVSGIWLAIYRARARGLSDETIYSLAFWLFISGIAGGRLFFVIEYWHQFRRDTLRDTLVEIFRFTEGGLVVYGAFIAGLIGIGLFCWRHKLPVFDLGDIVAPSLALGAALGRLGCLMNGCCYGGLCEGGPICVEFPRYNSVEQRSISPPYQHQLIAGRLHGFVLSANETSGEPVVKSVMPGSAAEQSGLKAGDQVIAINGTSTPDLFAAQKVLEKAGPNIAIATKRGWIPVWDIGSLPARSLPVHPVQVYSSIDALLLCLLMIACGPYFKRAGSVLALLLTLYPFFRVVEEMIRVDEPAKFGTGLTISQLVSVGMLLAAAALWVLIFRQSPSTSTNRRFAV